MKSGRHVTKYCETVFASVVIGACVFTILTTITSNRRVQSHYDGKLRVLKNARETFILAMRETKNRLLKSNTDQNVEKVDPVESFDDDQFSQWFTRNKVNKYKTWEHHPKVTKPIILNTDVCNSTDVDILIYFHSLWSHSHKRRALRETWANKNVFKDIKIRAIFILGKPPSQEDQLKINAENKMHKDIIQGNFTDCVGNLALKSILAVQWINDYCVQAKYIVKTDDDIFVNIFALIEYLISQIYDKRKTIMCQVKDNGTSIIVRDKHSKWYVPENTLPEMKYYPTFCSGYAVLFTTDLVPDLYRLSFVSPYFSVDDAYLFGILLSQIEGVKYEDISSALTLNQKTGIEEYTGNGPLVHVGILSWEEGYMAKLWQATLSKMTPWTQKHANVAMVQKTMAELLGKYPM